MMELPSYIIPCLERWDNTIITKRDLKKLGGKEKFLQLLKNKGFDCILKNSMSDKEHKQDGSRTYAHLVVVVKGSRWDE